MPATNFKIKTKIFEGPLDLLLDLIEKRKLFVNDVSLAQVTDDFIQYIEGHEEFPIGESAEFILIASTLMLVKSRSLLPMLELTEDEEASIDDLEKRLALYARAKELAARLKGIYGREIIFEKNPSKDSVIVFSPDSKTNAENLLESINKVLASLPKKEMVPKAVVRKMVTLEETIEKLAVRISKGMKTNFKDFYGKELGAGGKITYEKKVMIIVGFLAMLELVKRGALRVTQESKSGDIQMESEEMNVPNYA